MNEKKTTLVEMLGEDNVLGDPETLEAYSRDQSFTHPLKPSLVVRPQNVDEVQAIVQWANRTLTPLVPISSGPPHFHGDTIPCLGGTVIVDLRRLDRIIRIDRRSRMALIEPGVTFRQIQKELSKEGLKLSTPLLPRANKSVIASLLEREPVTVPKYQWTLLDPLKCLELIWGNGSRFRTGEAGEQRISLEEQWKLGISQTIPLGPGQVDYYRLVSAAQGSLGIVAWASIRCEVLPELHKLFFISAQKLKDLIHCAYRILRVRLGDELLILNRTYLKTLLEGNNREITGLEEDLPPWVIVIGIAGRDILAQERVEYQKKDILDIVQQSGLKLSSEVAGIRGDELLNIIQNPSAEPYWKLGRRGGFQDLFFLTTLNKTPEFINTIHAMAEAWDYPTSEVGAYIQPTHQGTSCHCEFHLPYDMGVNEQVTRMQNLFSAASEALMNQGAFFSRPYGKWADMVFNKNAQQTIILKKIKDIFDPNKVLNPGKLCFSTQNWERR